MIKIQKYNYTCVTVEENRITNMDRRDIYTTEGNRGCRMFLIYCTKYFFLAFSVSPFQETLCRSKHIPPLATQGESKRLDCVRTEGLRVAGVEVTRTLSPANHHFHMRPSPSPPLPPPYYWGYHQTRLRWSFVIKNLKLASGKKE